MMFLRIIGKEKKYPWIVKLQMIPKTRTSVHLKTEEILEMRLTHGRTLLQKAIRKFQTVCAKQMRILVSLLGIALLNKVALECCVPPIVYSSLRI